MDKIDISWAAGFFDGEGCISIVETFNKKGKARYDLRVNIGQVDPIPLTKFRNAFGGYFNKRKNGLYILDLVNHKAIEFLEKITHKLVVKKKEAQIALKFGRTLLSNKNNKPVPQELLIIRKDLRDRLKNIKDRKYNRL